MQKTPRIIGKVLLSGALAFCVLTLFSMVYANTPAHHRDPDGATDYRWEPDTFYSRAQEGFSFGHTNNEGYYCLRDYQAGDRIDVLVMGSSHMEASNVRPEQSTASRLDALLEDLVVYNIGTSAHTFPVCADNLENAVAKYKPRAYIIMETERLSFTEEELAAVLDHTMEDIPSLEGGLVAVLQKNQYLRLLYRQLQNHMGGKSIPLPAFLNRLRGGEQPEEEPADEPADNSAEPSSDSPSSEEEAEEMLRELLMRLSGTAEKSGARLVIFFHPSTNIYEDGLLHMEYYEEGVERFKRLCGECGILFVSMADRFAAEYEERYVIPYGFPDTLVGAGHLNKDGHNMIAEELYKLISEEP